MARGGVVAPTLAQSLPSASNLVNDVRARTQAAGDNLDHNIALLNPFHAPATLAEAQQRRATIMNPGGPAVGLGGALLNSAWAPVQGVLDTVAGRPISGATGGAIPAQYGGNIAAAALPFLGAVGSDAALSRAAASISDATGMSGSGARLAAEAQHAAAMAPRAPIAAPQASGILGGASGRAINYIGGLLDKPDPAMVAAHAAGKPVTTAEMLGPAGRNALATLARRPGATGGILESDMGDRLHSIPDMQMDDFARSTGIVPEAAKGDIMGQVQAARAAMPPKYQAVLQSGKPVMTPALAEIMGRPAVKEAMAMAAKSLRNAGRDPNQVGFGIDPDTGATPIDPTTQQPVPQQIPTAEAWDLTKKALADQVKRDPITNRVVTQGPEGRFNADTNTAAHDLTTELRSAIPGYGNVLDQAGDYLRMQRAFEDGANHVLNRKVFGADVNNAVKGLSGPELQAYRGGVANRLFEQAQNGTLTPKLLQTKNVQAKLSAALGPENAATFSENIGHTHAMANNARQMAPQGGSQSMPLLAETARQDAVGGLKGILAPVPAEFGTGAIVGLAHGLEGALHGGVTLASIGAARRLASATTAGLRDFSMPIPVRDEVGGILGAHGPDAIPPEVLQQYIRALKGPSIADRLTPPPLNGAPLPAGLLAAPSATGLLGQQQR